MNWKGTKVLVTGAGGFIGSHLGEELARRGAKVRALVHYNSRGHWGFLESRDADIARRIEVRPGDIADPHLMLDLIRDQEVVFHLAALIAIPYSYIAPASFVHTNINGTLNVLEACLKRKVKKMVHTSTSEVYGTAKYTPIDEKHPLQGQSPYSASKIAADHLAESFHRSFGLPVAVVRPFNTYGPRQSARAVIPTIISQLLGQGALRLGSLSPIRDFNYVKDTVDGLIRAAESANSVGVEINLGSGRAVSIGATAHMVMKLMNRKAAVKTDAGRVRPRQSEVFELVCDNRKARRLLGWKPRHSLEQGLALTIPFIQSHRYQYKAALYNV